jgi:hypothetical protein
MVGMAVFHLIFGILIPVLYLLYLRSKLVETPQKTVIFAWIFLSWSLFFMSATIYITTNYVIGKGIGGISAAIIGLLPFGVLTILFFLQFMVQFHKK